MHRLFLTTELSLSSGALLLIRRPTLILSQIVDICSYQMSNQHKISQRAVTPSQKPDACSHKTLICHIPMHIKFCIFFNKCLYTFKYWNVSVVAPLLCTCR